LRKDSRCDAIQCEPNSGAKGRRRLIRKESKTEGVSRIYCSIHVRTAMEMGFWQGGRIAHYVDDNLLRPVYD
jgi:hypothetical protein